MDLVLDLEDGTWKIQEGIRDLWEVSLVKEAWYVWQPCLVRRVLGNLFSTSFKLQVTQFQRVFLYGPKPRYSSWSLGKGVHPLCSFLRERWSGQWPLCGEAQILGGDWWPTWTLVSNLEKHLKDWFLPASPHPRPPEGWIRNQKVKDFANIEKRPVSFHIALHL